MDTRIVEVVLPNGQGFLQEHAAELLTDGAERILHTLVDQHSDARSSSRTLAC